MSIPLTAGSRITPFTLTFGYPIRTLSFIEPIKHDRTLTREKDVALKNTSPRLRMDVLPENAFLCIVEEHFKDDAWRPSSTWWPNTACTIFSRSPCV